MDENILQLGLLEDETIQLDAAALDFAALDHPGTDLADYVALLSEISTKLADVGDNAIAAMAQSAALAQVIAGEYRFSGDRETYNDSGNADLIRVIDRR